MTASSIDPACFLHEHLASASPNLLHQMSITTRVPRGPGGLGGGAIGHVVGQIAAEGSERA
jgi:hypothetical protein